MDSSGRGALVLPPTPKWTTSTAVGDDGVKRSRKYEPKAPLCYNCRTEGHIARDCPKPRRPCSNFGSTRHTCSHCTSTQEAAEITAGKSDACLVESITPTSNQNPFFKTVQLNGKLVDGLVDTGASDASDTNDQPERERSTIRDARPKGKNSEEDDSPAQGKPTGWGGIASDASKTFTETF